MQEITVHGVTFAFDLEDVDLEGMSLVDMAGKMIAAGNFQDGFSNMEKGLKLVIGEDVYNQIFANVKKSSKNIKQLLQAITPQVKA